MKQHGCKNCFISKRVAFSQEDILTGVEDSYIY